MDNTKDILDAHKKVEHHLLMNQLAEKHLAIAQLIQKKLVHYVDVPFHENVGDLLILKGTLEFFKKNKVNVKTKSGFFNFSPSWVRPDEIVVFQGGGNFGDLYKGPQQIRENCIRKLTGNRIIILPQTIHFESQQAYEQCCALMSAHPDLHICVRDRTSFELASSMTKYVYLLPDMAHQLWPLGKKRTSHKRTLGFLRTDGERKISGDVKADDTIDWPALVGSRRSIFPLIQKCMRILHLLRMDRKLVTTEMDLWISYADHLVEEAIELFSHYDNVVTDRLHGHILACLMHMPNVIHDNSYRKNSQYVSAWTAQSTIVTLVI